jgi:hypothetical protein
MLKYPFCEQLNPVLLRSVLDYELAPTQPSDDRDFLANFRTLGLFSGVSKTRDGN